MVRDKCLVDFGNLQSAQKTFSDILTKNPFDTEILYCRGILRVESGQYKAAIVDLTTLIETEPTAGAYLNRGEAWRKLGEIEKSDIDLANASKINGTSVGYYISAKILQSIGRFHDAIIDYKKSIAIKPDKMNAINDLAWLYATCENKAFRDGKEALKLAQGVRIKLGWPHQYAIIAAAYAELGDFDNARSFQEQAIVKAKDIYGSKSIQYYYDMLEKFYANEPWSESDLPTFYGKNTTNRR